MFHIFGFELASAPPTHEAMLQRIHPADVGKVRGIIDEAVRTQTEFRFRARVMIGGEPIKYVETVGHPVCDSAGVVEFFGTSVDITNHARANRLLRRAVRARYAAVLEERTRLAREMHDGLLQDITGIALQLRALLPHVYGAPDAFTARLQELVALAERTSHEARAAVAGMRRAEGVGDLVTAVESGARRAVGKAPVALAITVSGRGHSRLASTKVCDAAKAIAQEAMTNVVKHAAAQSAQLRVVFGRAKVRLQVIDDGCGIGAVAPTSLGDHFGVRGMRERAAAVGASFTLERATCGGTAVTVVFPYG